ncbi:MAG: DNA/RNA nuclease SfsA [Pseudomonadota bacterium]
MLIPHERPLERARLRARYDRFIAEVELADGRVVDAHCVNPGRMEGLVRPGARAWVSDVPPESKRKLRYTLELLEIDGRYVGANTVVPNRIAEALIRGGCIPGLKRFRELRREVRYGERSRIDLLLTSGDTEHLVEVKNCHLVYPDGSAYFPDSVSERATGHLMHLSKEVAAGRKATVLFVLQRPDGRRLRPSRLHDPAFAEAATAAAAARVRVKAAHVHSQPAGFAFLGMIPVDLKPYAPEALAPYRAALAPYSGWKRRGHAKRGR